MPVNHKVLIISPYFPPSNTADLHRIRMSLPHFSNNGWEAEVVTVHPHYADMPSDELLMQNIPSSLKIHYVAALNKKWTSRIGLGSLGLRSLWFYWKKVKELLENDHFDLIYFSTTQFPVVILGALWKKQFKTPYIIDMQDPWHSDYYVRKPKNQRPPKYWFVYRMHKYMEPIAMRHVSGLISVSDDYISTLVKRYPRLKAIPYMVSPFGFAQSDLTVALENRHQFSSLLPEKMINIVYIGRGGQDMHRAIRPLFEVLHKGLTSNPERFSNIRVHFIGTSYAPKGTGIPSIMPLAKHFQVDQLVNEVTNRISFYHTLLTLHDADALFVPGSDDPQYSASKIYPYLQSKQPLITIFHPDSNVSGIIEQCVQNALTLTFSDKDLHDRLQTTIDLLLAGKLPALTFRSSIGQYEAAQLTSLQTQLFDRVIHKHKS
ncbi:hypothetical protein PBAL39_05028 [Pedobacter sp. BAL39]|uniref:hypothetical protein n=1 Tax=Pedobacter sp. BAL39 TaxID=391596 RepID=UPI00015593F0|nr:hypothetical protein [Pedobacter sp. BAL39]EDM37134.1 hypothetical protein PBAL39_05028 [Pedobacter sp. BAL39]